VQLTFRSYLILTVVALPFIFDATAPDACSADLQGSLAKVQSDLQNIESEAGMSTALACGFVPFLQADVNLVLGISKLTAQQSKDVQSAQAVINTICENPATVNSATLIAKIGAAIAQVNKIQNGAQ